MPIFKQKLRESIDTIKTFLQEKKIVFSYTLIRKEQKFKLKKKFVCDKWRENKPTTEHKNYVYIFNH